MTVSAASCLIFTRSCASTPDSPPDSLPHACAVSEHDPYMCTAGRQACMQTNALNSFFFTHKYAFMCSGESRKLSECVYRQALNWYSYRALTFTAAYCFQSRLFFLYSPKKKKTKSGTTLKSEFNISLGFPGFAERALQTSFKAAQLRKYCI